jgi:S-adenosylmethionine:tRNA ribosyltransferase-isomerase
MKRLDFFYPLPLDRIAKEPCARRDASKLLFYKRQDQSLEDHAFYELPQIIKKCFPGKKVLFVLNNSKVYPARVPILRATGGKGEVFLLAREATHGKIPCLIKPQKRMKVGEILYTPKDHTPLFEVEDLAQDGCKVKPLLPLDLIFERYAQIPPPPYIERQRSEEEKEKFQVLDKERYQTVYAKDEGSVAAPTAGLHFTPEIMKACEDEGAVFASVSLHVGIGTFRPVQVEDISHHMMHTEYYSVPQKTLERILEWHQNKDPIIFIGTTSLRSVESFFHSLLNENDKNTEDDKIKEGDKNKEDEKIKRDHKNKASLLSYKLEHDPLFLERMKNQAEKLLATKLFIYPENPQDHYTPFVGNGLITNFHQPESTLLMLVSSLIGFEAYKTLYAHALKNDYRFLSYGDSNLLLF